MKPPLKMILGLMLEATTLRIVTGTGCLFPLGMVSGDIGDDQLSASSSYSDRWLPKYARLNNGRAWSPSANTKSEWLQIDLLERKVISRIQTQGLQIGIWPIQNSYYVTSFKLSSSDDQINWITFQENRSDKVFVGNRNANSMQDNGINPPIRARFIRLMAETWNNNIAFRLELLGCEIQGTTTQISSTTTTTPSTTNVATTGAITTTKQQTTRSTPVNTYPMSYTRSTPVTMEGITSVVPQRSTSSAISRPGTPSSSSNNTSSGNSDGLAGNQTGTPSVAIIGGAAAAGVVVIIAIIVSIFLIRRRRSKPRDGKEPSPQADEGTVDNIYYGGVTFAANGNASTNGHVSIGQSEGMVDNNLYTYAGATNGRVTIGQSEGMVDNHLYAGTSTTNGTLPFDQSEGTVDNHLYAGTEDTCLETRHYAGDDSAQDSVYYNVAHTSDEGVVENDIYC